MLTVCIMATILCRTIGGASNQVPTPIQVSTTTNITNNPAQPTTNPQGIPQPATEAKPRKSIWGSMRRTPKKLEQRPDEPNESPPSYADTQRNKYEIPVQFDKIRQFIE